MQIISGGTQLNSTSNQNTIKGLYTQKLTKDETKELRALVVENANAFTFKSTSIQSSSFSLSDKFTQAYDEFQSFLKDVGYKGKPIAQLSQSEAADLVSEDGFFGIKETAQRIANFVINGAGGNEELLRAGREGILQGFKDAQSALGGEVPEISQKTIDAATELVDKNIHDLGFSILNKEA